MHDIEYAKEGAIASVRFNRPQKKNAITVAMYAALAESLDDASADSNIRAVGIFGGADFTAGNDIADFLRSGPLSDDMPVLKFLHALKAFPKPLIAGVKGVAIGIGATMLMHCDSVVAGHSARFSMPFTKLGLVPEAGVTALLPLVSGRTRASWLLLSGEQFDAIAAREMGMVTRITQDCDVDGAVALMCGELAQLPPAAVAATKRLIKAPFMEAVDRAMDEEVRAMATALQSEETRSTLMRFFGND